MAITYDKDGAYIETTENGVVYRRAIKWKDCVVSVPGNGNQKVDMAYIDSLDQLVLVLEDESEITITAGAGDMLKSVYDPNDEGEIRLTPKAASTGAEGTIFYDSDNDHVWVATE